MQLVKDCNLDSKHASASFTPASLNTHNTCTRCRSFPIAYYNSCTQHWYRQWAVLASKPGKHAHKCLESVHTFTRAGSRPFQRDRASRAAHARTGPYARASLASGVCMPPGAEAHRLAHCLHLWGRAKGATGALKSSCAGGMPLFVILSVHVRMCACGFWHTCTPMWGFESLVKVEAHT